MRTSRTSFISSSKPKQAATLSLAAVFLLTSVLYVGCGGANGGETVLDSSSLGGGATKDGSQPIDGSTPGNEASDSDKVIDDISQQGNKPPKDNSPDGNKSPEDNMPDGNKPPEDNSPDGNKPPEENMPDGNKPPKENIPGGNKPPEENTPGGNKPPEENIPGDTKPPEENIPGGNKPPEQNPGDSNTIAANYAVQVQIAQPFSPIAWDPQGPTEMPERQVVLTLNQSTVQVGSSSQASGSATFSSLVERYDGKGLFEYTPGGSPVMGTLRLANCPSGSPCEISFTFAAPAQVVPLNFVLSSGSLTLPDGKVVPAPFAPAPL